MDLTVRNSLVYTDGSFERVDIGIEGPRIAEIGDVEPGSEDLDLSGHVLVPGLINAHTHASMTIFRGYADDYPFEEWLHEQIIPVEQRLSSREIRIGAELAALEMIRSGTVAFGDMYYQSSVIADTVESAGLKAALGQVVFTDGLEREAATESIREATEFAAQNHGAADGRLRSLVTPHAPYSVEEWALESFAEQAAEIGCPTHIHLNETASEVSELTAETGSRPALELEEIGFWEPDGYVAHGIHLNESEMAVMANRGIGVAHCPTANMKLATGMAPIDELLEAGVRVGLGTDGPASNNNLDMFEEMKVAALLGKIREQDASVLDAETVFEMATRAGADLLGFESGRIEVGKPADIVALDVDQPHLSPGHDLVSHLVYAASGQDVTTTIVDGRVLYHDDEVRTLDEERILGEMDSIETFFAEE